MSQITYIFAQADRPEIRIDMEFDDETFEYRPVAVPRKMKWAKLNNHRCPNCPLPVECGYCPTAVAVLSLPEEIFSYISYEPVDVKVITGNRTISASTTYQRAIASLLGLLSATGGCPWASYFRPLARYHLPFADEKETLFRTLSMAILGSYLTTKQNQNKYMPDIANQVKMIYSNLSIVNEFFAERVREAFEKDALVNAVVVLDFFAKVLPMDIEAGLDKVKEIFPS